MIMAKGKHKKVCLIVLAAGSGTRFGSVVPKQFTCIDGVPLITYTIQHVAAPLASVLSRLVVVVPPAYVHEGASMVPEEFRSNSTVIAGGRSRTESLRYALAHIEREAYEYDWVVVHDGVRPHVSSRDILRMWNTCKKGTLDVLMLSQPVKEALLLKKNNGRVAGVNKDGFLVAQTPYFIAKDTVTHMFRVLNRKNVTASTDMSELCASKRGVRIGHHPATTANTKLTHAHDLLIVSDALRSRDAWI